ncbi:MAG: CinA family protein [Nitrospirota bacterium]
MDRALKTVVRKVHDLFKEKGLTLSAAESCTGGLVCHLLTSLPGASGFFEAGVVSYSADAKRRILGVSADVIRRYGVVSEQTAKEMARKVRIVSRTDFSLSTTGNLGPDALEGKDRGLVYIAVAGKGKTWAKELRLSGDREENKREAALEALKFLIEIVERAYYAGN